MSALDKKYYHNIDLDSNELKAGRVYNLTTTQKNALGLNTTDKGYIVYDTNLLSLYVWNGTAWTTAAGGSGTVTSVATGTGLTGGSITSTGTISLNSKLSPADSLTGNAGKFLRVNSGETAVEYATASSSGGIPHATASGTDNYTTTITGVTAYTDGDAYLIQFTIGNTDASTLNINSLGAISLYRNNGGAIIGGDIVAGGEMLCIYDSTITGFRLIGTSPNTLFAYVVNADSVAITRGQPVYAFGSTGNRMSVKLAYNTTDATSAQTYGLVYSTSIAAGQKGIIIIQGVLDGINLGGTWVDGDPVYLGSTAGSLTKTKPYAPNHLVYLGVVERANAGNGIMYVRVQNGYELDELHNVQAQTPSTNDVLYYFGSNQWKTASISTILGYTPIQYSSLSGTAPVSYNNTTGAISMAAATASVNGYLSSTDWTNFNTAYTNRITSLTTTGSGAATLVSNVLNIPIPSSVPPNLDQVLTQGNTSSLNAFVNSIGVRDVVNNEYVTILGTDGGIQIDTLSIPSLLILQGDNLTFGGTNKIGLSNLLLTASRSYSFPDSNGTIVLNSSYGTNNISANNFFGGFTSVAASGTIITLTVNSTQSYLITGSGGQTIKMPDATTLPKGATYYISNKQSAGTINVNDNSNTLIKLIQPGGYLIVTLLDNTTTAGSWDVHFQAPSNVTWGTATLDYAGSITSATWDGNVIPITKGGTGSAIQNFVDLVTTQTIGGLKTFSTAPALNSLTASQLLALDSSKGIQTLDVATYPSLTELAFVKGVTSGIQTQLGGKLTSTLTSANIFVGNGSNVATGVALSGDATISNTGSLTIANNAVTLAKMQTIGTGTILGNISGATGVPSALTSAQVTTMLSAFSTSNFNQGLVIGSNGVGITYFLRADGTWAVPAGGGGSTPSSYNYITSTNFS